MALTLIKNVSDVLRTDAPGKVGRDAYLLAHTQLAAYELLEPDGELGGRQGDRRSRAHASGRGPQVRRRGRGALGRLLPAHARRLARKGRRAESNGDCPIAVELSQPDPGDFRGHAQSSGLSESPRPGSGSESPASRDGGLVRGIRATGRARPRRARRRRSSAPSTTSSALSFTSSHLSFGRVLDVGPLLLGLAFVLLLLAFDPIGIHVPLLACLPLGSARLRTARSRQTGVVFLRPGDGNASVERRRCNGNLGMDRHRGRRGRRSDSFSSSTRCEGNAGTITCRSASAPSTTAPSRPRAGARRAASERRREAARRARHPSADARRARSLPRRVAAGRGALRERPRGCGALRRARRRSRARGPRLSDRPTRSSRRRTSPSTIRTSSSVTGTGTRCSRPTATARTRRTCGRR